jgi:hypothetical protein
MSDTKPTERLRLFPEEALADIRTLARFALQSGARMKRDLEMILTIVELALPLNKRSQTPPE